jgi:hypothetical protein
LSAQCPCSAKYSSLMCSYTLVSSPGIKADIPRLQNWSFSCLCLCLCLCLYLSISLCLSHVVQWKIISSMNTGKLESKCKSVKICWEGANRPANQRLSKPVTTKPRPTSQAGSLEFTVYIN